MDWSAVDYCDVFIRLSFWRHPFTAEHPLLRHISTNLMKKLTHPNLNIFGEHIFSKFSFWVNYSFMIKAKTWIRIIPQLKVSHLNCQSSRSVAQQQDKQHLKIKSVMWFTSATCRLHHWKHCKTQRHTPYKKTSKQAEKPYENVSFTQINATLSFMINDWLHVPCHSNINIKENVKKITHIWNSSAYKSILLFFSSFCKWK